MINASVPVLQAPVQLKGDQLHILILDDTAEGLRLLTGGSDAVDEVECTINVSICTD